MFDSLLRVFFSYLVDRRKQLRRKVEVPAVFRLSRGGLPASGVPARIFDLSLSGCGIVVPTAQLPLDLALSPDLEVTLQVGEELGQEVSVKARIARVAPLDGGRELKLGLRFVGATSELRAGLIALRAPAGERKTSRSEAA